MEETPAATSSFQLIVLANGIVREINEWVTKLNQERGTAQPATLPPEHTALIARLSRLLTLTADAEPAATAALRRIEDGALRPCTPVLVRTAGSLWGIVSPDVAKPRVAALPPLAEACHCPSTALPPFKLPTAHTAIDSEDALLALDRTLSVVCMQVFAHTYRSYRGFVCYISVLRPDGALFLIDAVRYRATLPRLRLLRCGVVKVLHCTACAARLSADFGSLGCVRCLSVPAEPLWIDWRIRPLAPLMARVVANGMHVLAEMANQGLHAAPFQRGAEEAAGDRAEAFLQAHEISEGVDVAVLGELLTLRTCLAADADESEEYVMTDAQILALLEAQPRTTADMLGVLSRLSPVARRRLPDFVCVFARRKSAVRMLRGGSQRPLAAFEGTCERLARTKSERGSGAEGHFVGEVAEKSDASESVTAELGNGSRRHRNLSKERLESLKNALCNKNENNTT